MDYFEETSSEIFERYGFEDCSQTKMFYHLQKLCPDGGTALRDSIKTGLGLIVRMCEELNNSNSLVGYNIIHIVITDGSDEHSRLSAEQLGQILYGFNQQFGSSLCQTVLVGISLNQSAAAELSYLSQVGGESCKAFNVENVDFSEILQRISINFGVRQEFQVGILGQNLLMANRNIPYMQITRKKLAILFNLDFSSSMRGFRWNSLIESAAEFVSQLSQGDLVSCILFNHEVKMLNQVAEDFETLDIFSNLIQGILLLGIAGNQQAYESDQEISQSGSSFHEDSSQISEYSASNSLNSSEMYKANFKNNQNVVELSSSDEYFETKNKYQAPPPLALEYKPYTSDSNQNEFKAVPNSILVNEDPSQNNNRLTPSQNKVEAASGLNNFVQYKQTSNPNRPSFEEKKKINYINSGDSSLRSNSIILSPKHLKENENSVGKYSPKYSEHPTFLANAQSSNSSPKKNLSSSKKKGCNCCLII